MAETSEVTVPPELIDSLRELDAIRKDLENTTTKIKKLHQKMDSLTGSAKLESWARLRSLYAEAISLSEKEENLTLACSDMVETAIEDWESVHTGKKRKKPESQPARRGPIPLGEKVACLHEDNWILCTIKSYNAKKNEYKVEDADEEANRMFIVGSHEILALNTPDLPKGTRVLALYPGTTCFYPAEVVAFTKRGSKPNTYRLQFEDDFEDGREKQTRIEQLFVVQDPSASSK
eukprot:c8444_g1_i1.p1 GENE.c8444_g1_i1~~c8444_g1_i1.p1  ORF type:complete len:248 (+),score=54.56 c8444_g1_i1:43-744(+)